MKNFLYVSWEDPESSAWFPVGKVEFDGDTIHPSSFRSYTTA